MLRAMEEKMTLKKMHLFLAAELLLISLYAVMIPERPVQAAQKKTIFIMGDSKSRYYSDEERPRDGLSDGRMWEVLTARYFSAICLPDCTVMHVTA